MLITIRHFHDQNALKSFGHDAPLYPNQELLLHKTIEKLLTILSEEKIKILYTKKTRRIHDTAHLIANELRRKWKHIELNHDPRLEVMDQWDLILPDNYKDGERFTPLDVARDIICDESYKNKNLFYKFWDHKDNAYPILKENFSRAWSSMAESLIKKYSLITDLIEMTSWNNDFHTVVVAQSDLPLILLELLEVQNKKRPLIPKELPFQCWDVYKSWLQEEMYDKNAISEVWNFDTPMGYVGVFDLSKLKERNFHAIIKSAQWILFQQLQHG